MDASFREDLVELICPLDGDVPGNWADRAVMMLAKSKRGVETDDHQSDAQLIDYKSPTGQDGQFKLFNYQYGKSLTPRTVPDTVAALSCGAPFLTLEDINEEYESADFTFSSETPTIKPSIRQAQLSASTNGGLLYHSPGAEDYLQAPDDKAKVVHGARSVDSIGNAHKASRVCAVLPQAKQGPCGEHEPYVEESQGLLNDHLDGREIFRDPKKPNLLNTDGTSQEESTKRPQGNRRKDPSEAPTPFDSIIIHAGSERSVHSVSLSLQDLHGKNKWPAHSTAPMSYNDPDGKVVKSAAEEITTALSRIDLEPKMAGRILGPNTATEPLLAEPYSNSPKAANMDFQLMTHSVFGTGFWIEEGNNLLDLDVEGLCEIYAMDNDLGPLERWFSGGWKSTLTKCPGESASSGSRPENTSGESSGEMGSSGTHQSPSNGGNRHHKRPSEGGDGLEDEDDPDPSKKARFNSVSARRLVCPFFVNDSQYFRTSSEHGTKYMVCAAGKGFRDIARLKEHLHRVHSPEIFCARCGSKFDEQGDLEKHLRHEDGPECPRIDLPPPKSMTSTMKAKLSRRGKREMNLSDEDKWFNIYQLLFPTEPRPTTSAYRQDSDQPSTPSHEKQIQVHISERDLPRLLKRRLDTQLGFILSDPDSREQVKRMVISELIGCIKQITTDLPETPMSFDESDVLRHKQSGESSADSGYGSRCGKSDCMGNCSVCEQLAPLMFHPSHPYTQQPSSPSFDVMYQYVDPSVFIDPTSTGNLQLTENMDELLENNFPTMFWGNCDFDSFDA